MLILLIMLAGIVVGLRWFPQRWSAWNLRIQMGCTAVLIFAMGVKLGSRENFLQELSQLGFASLLYAVIPIILSVAAVYVLTRRFLKQAHPEGGTEQEIQDRLAEQLKEEFLEQSRSHPSEKGE